jgi:hypothetical protein
MILSLLALMASCCAVSVLYGIYAMVFFITKRHFFAAVKTLLFLLPLPLAAMISIVPALKMNGTYTDEEHSIIALLWLVIIIINLIYIKTRHSAIEKVKAKLFLRFDSRRYRNPR